MKYHWEYHAPRQWQKPIPRDVDFVIGLKSMMGHSEQDTLRAAAKLAGVPVMTTSHKWTHIITLMQVRFGITALNSTPLLDTTLHATPLHRARADEPEDAPSAPQEAPQAPTLVVAAPGDVQAAEEELRALRVKFAQQDTMTLIRELQARIVLHGGAAVLITPTEITFQTTKPEPKEKA